MTYGVNNKGEVLMSKAKTKARAQPMGPERAALVKGMLKQGRSPADVAELVGVSSRNVDEIRRGACYETVRPADTRKISRYLSPARPMNGYVATNVASTGDLSDGKAKAVRQFIKVASDQLRTAMALLDTH